MIIFVVIISGQFVILHAMSGNISKMNKHIGDITIVKSVMAYRNIELPTLGQKLPNELKLTSVTTQHTTKEVLSGRKTLVYNFTQMQCKMCIESQIKALKSIFGNDTTNVVLLANTTNYRDLFVLSHTYNIKYPIYKLEGSLKLPTDTLMMPYFMLVDEDLRIVNVFITMKERMNYSIAYLKSMYRYFHSDSAAASTFDIAIDQKQIDLGNVKNGSTKNVVFAIANNSDQDIQLNLIPDCDCTTVDFGSNTLQAQEKRQITATIKFDGEGEFVKYIYVYFNNNQTPKEIEIYGCVN